MPSPTLFERARNYIAKMPAAVSGSGGHDATIHVACILLQGFDLPRGEARQVLDEYNARCAPPWSDRELEHKLNQADKMPGLQTRDGLMPRGCMAGDDGSGQMAESREPVLPSRARSAALPVAPVPKAEYAADKLRTFAQRWRGLVDTAWLAERSAMAPAAMADGRWQTLKSDDYLKAVFRDGEKVVLFTNQQSQGQAMWPLQRPPERGDEGVWYLCQPVDGMEYVNPRAGLDKKTGQPKMSRRSAESVIDWRHLVLESDEADEKDWLAALVQFPLRITAIYTSGGRSIHALVRVDAKSEGDWNQVVKQIRPIFVTLGADPKAMSAVRLTRLPGCWRGDRLQKLLYLNPDPKPEPICTLPRLRDVLGDAEKIARNLLRFAPADVNEQGGWEEVDLCEAAFSWFASAKRARELLAELRAWKGQGK